MSRSMEGEAARICVIGNSHVACLKAAESAPGAEAGPPAAYFAASANLISELRRGAGRWLEPGEGRAGRQIAAVASGETRIDLDAYDAFVLLGVCFQFRDFLRLFRTHCLWRHRAWRGARALIGDPAFTAFLRSLHRHRPAYRLAREIAAARPGVPVLLLPAPYPAAAALDDPAMRELGPLRGTPYFDAIAALHRACAQAAARSAGARLVLQRPETCAAPGFTAERFNVQGLGLRPLERATERPNARRWHARRPEGDPWHMNAAFGRTRLEDIRLALGLPEARAAGAQGSMAQEGAA